MNVPEPEVDQFAAMVWLCLFLYVFGAPVWLAVVERFDDDFIAKKDWPYAIIWPFLLALWLCYWSLVGPYRLTRWILQPKTGD